MSPLFECEQLSISHIRRVQNMRKRLQLRICKQQTNKKQGPKFFNSPERDIKGGLRTWWWRLQWGLLHRESDTSYLYHIYTQLTETLCDHSSTIKFSSSHINIKRSSWVYFIEYVIVYAIQPNISKVSFEHIVIKEILPLHTKYVWNPSVYPILTAHLNLVAKFSPKIIYLYLESIKFTVEKVDSHFQSIPNVLKSSPISKLSTNFNI